MERKQLTDEEVVAAHLAGGVATEHFRQTLNALVEEATAVDALEFLARGAMTVIINRLNQKPEKKTDLQLFHLELMQALALSRPRASADSKTDYALVTERIVELIAQNAQAHQDQAKSKVSADVLEDLRQEMLNLIQRWTLAVRGARQGYQTRQYALELALSVNGSFRHHYGCDATEVVKALSAVIDVCEDRITAHMEDMRSWMMLKHSGKGMLEAFIRNLEPDEQAEISSRAAMVQHDREQLFALLWNINEHRWMTLFKFSYLDLVATAPIEQRYSIIDVLSQLSLDFGDVTEANLQHLHLDNPVQRKPLIRLDGNNFFCAGPQILGVHLAEIVENLCGTGDNLKRAAEKARADWLEGRLSATVRQFLPHADVHEQVKWSDNGGITTWESDLVAIIDKTVLIFEAKSAKISAPARRGALRSLKAALNDLIVAPSEQSLRLKQYILGASGSVSFISRQGSLILQANEVRDVIRVNIVHDAVGPLSSHWPQLKHAGFVPENADIAPTMSVFDLETLFELVPRELERCHYLSRRAELERNAIYTADELDLLALYSRTRFNIGEDEFDGRHHPWYGLSGSLTYVPDENRRVRLSAMSAITTEFWAKLLDALEDRMPEGWTRFGHRLLNVHVSHQKQIEKSVKEGMKKTRKRSDLFFHSEFTFGTRDKMQTISVAVGAEVPPWQFALNLVTCAESARSQGDQGDVLVLYWFMPRTSEPYDFIGLVKQRQAQAPYPQLNFAGTSSLG
ncbi:hypothetical protein [Sinorhizobium prairiense]|uniref:hypothetical protein n=1 Tax=unclassified Sinorhizobium TaxID=2613772 RepID=UPI0023D8C10E|nr:MULTISPECIES: hypothetical protein [unclassified Sinorhizobium]WEJ08476.1 hypothetical protein N0Q90_01985 [Sinorhizobium sp. M103]WEJ14021.1 hypothetical protein N0Q91_00730 [Sinorhizobium sp. K101]WEJ35620.1 hypothetical protein N0R80_00725 [Sinorhizobium sp. C101]